MKKATLAVAVLALMVSILFPILAAADEVNGDYEVWSVVKWQSGHRLYNIDLLNVQIKNAGHRVYIPINQYDTNDVVAAGIALDVMDKFEKENPSLEVTNWKPMYIATSHSRGIHFVGIYVDFDYKFKKK